MIKFANALRMARVLMGCALAVALTSCKAPALDPETDAVARAAYTELRTNSSAFQARLSSDLRTPQGAADIAKIKTYIPPGEPSLGKAVGWNYVTMLGQGKTAFLSHEYDYPGKVVLSQISLKRPEGAKTWTLIGLNVRVATSQELETLKFSLVGKSPAQYAFLAAMVASLALMLAALVKVIRTKGLKRKWLWVIASLFGVGSVQMNWFNGVFAWQLVNVSLIGAGAAKGFSRFDPWTLSFILPLGAILILTGVWARPKAAPTPDAAL
ncbi:hypothetical protein ASD79_03585 [Caulobacter sp. Root655]|uniref:hypothetical protein n=1 Tax=Caulobacter sp. Root655 TaxID=1736578 RepID=UPI0006F6C0EC|nr:hypothetical protein [Caulobacter sp. Root655]KRA66368.1 hypothetical protein ASD79_03585 [Caulobacter sp. Root655]